MEFSANDIIATLYNRGVNTRAEMLDALADKARITELEQLIEEGLNQARLQAARNLLKDYVPPKYSARIGRDWRGYRVELDAEPTCPVEGGFETDAQAAEWLATDPYAQPLVRLACALHAIDELQKAGVDEHWPALLELGEAEVEAKSVPRPSPNQAMGSMSPGFGDA